MPAKRERKPKTKRIAIPVNEAAAPLSADDIGSTAEPELLRRLFQNDFPKTLTEKLREAGEYARDGDHDTAIGVLRKALAFAKEWVAQARANRQTGWDSAGDALILSLAEGMLAEIKTACEQMSGGLAISQVAKTKNMVSELLAEMQAMKAAIERMNATPIDNTISVAKGAKLYAELTGHTREHSWFKGRVAKRDPRFELAPDGYLRIENVYRLALAMLKKQDKDKVSSRGKHKCPSCGRRFNGTPQGAAKTCAACFQKHLEKLISDSSQSAIPVGVQSSPPLT